MCFPFLIYKSSLIIMFIIESDDVSTNTEKNEKHQLKTIFTDTGSFRSNMLKALYYLVITF